MAKEDCRQRQGGHKGDKPRQLSTMRPRDESATLQLMLE
jgi:hypothetical protein